MKLRFDFVMHWLWTIAFAILTISGIAMVGPRYGWILNYDIAAADFAHRVIAALFVLLTFIIIAYEIIRAVKNDGKYLAWQIIGKQGYQLFTFITTLIFIVTGAVIWVCMDTNMAATSFALYVHEKLTYIVLASVIWHIYMKCHVLLWPKKTKNNSIEANESKKI
ncbi:MAG: cytochrome b/b6 domain-containing protein [Bacillota bacterium]